MDKGFVDLRVIGKAGKPITVPIEGRGVGVFWLGAESGNSSNDIIDKGGWPTLVTNNSIPGRLVSFTFNVPVPQNPAPGSFQACVGGLGGTGFNQEAADLINNISGEGTSRELLAVTWMNESSFVSYPNPYTNGHPEDVTSWDVGPFQINVRWTLAQVAAKEVSFGGLNERNVFGYDFYRSDGKTPLAFTGDPHSNARMGARRLNAISGSDENKAIKYTAPGARPARKTSYETYAGRFRAFFKCYHPQ
jgi:hypothetical protein